MAEGQSRKNGFLVATSFFAGIVLNLVILGALAGRMGGILSESFGRFWALAMAVISFIAAAVSFAGPRLKIDQLVHLRRPGIAGAFSYGFIFSLGTSASPLLLLLTIAAATGRPSYGLLLALAFGIGRGLPFLVIGLFAGAISSVIWITKWRRAIQYASGSALVLVGIYYARAFAALL